MKPDLKRLNRDFYVVGGTMRPDAPSYVERTADRDLLSALLSGEFCHVLTARQMGKSSLMLRTAAALRESGVVAAVLDLTALGQNLTPEQWYAGLIVQIGDRLGLEEETLRYWRSENLTGPMQRWLGTIRRVVMPNVQGRLAVFIDEIDAVGSLPFSTDEFFAGIRECYNLRNEDPGLERLTFCLLGVATPADLIRDTRATPFNIGKRIEVNDFNPTEALTLAEGLGRRTEHNLAILKRILYWTNGHPYLTQRMCQGVSVDREVHHARHVDRVVEHAFFAKRARENDDNLIFVRERLLRSGGDITELLNTYSSILRGKRVLDDDSSPFVSVLSLSGITRAEAGVLRSRNRIYASVFDRDWINSNLPDAEVRRQREAFKRGAWRVAGISTTILGIIAALALVALWQAKRAQDQAADNKQLLYVARMKVAHQELENANIPRVSELVEVTRDENDLRGFEWYLFERSAHSEMYRLPETVGDTGRIAAVRFMAKNFIATAVASHSMVQNKREYILETYDRSAERYTTPFRVPAGDNYDIAVFSPDLNYIATDSPDNSVIVRYLSNGAEFRSLPGDGSAITALAFAPGRPYLAAAFSDGNVKLWDLRTGKLIRSKPARKKPSLVFSSDGRLLAYTVEPGQTIDVRSVDTGKELYSLSMEALVCTFPATSPKNPGDAAAPSPLRLLGFSKDSRRLVAATMSGDLCSWDLDKGSAFVWPGRHAGEVLWSVNSRDGSQLATGSVDRTVKLWDWTSGKEIRTIKDGAEVSAIDWSDDGKLLMTGDADGLVKIWDLNAVEPPVKPRDTIVSWRAAGFSPGGSVLGVGVTAECHVKVFDLSTGNSVADLGILKHCVDLEMPLPAAFSKDASMVAAQVNTEVRVCDIATGTVIRSLPFAEDSLPLGLDFSPDGSVLLSGDKKGNLILWEISSGNKLRTLNSGNGYYRAVFSPDGKFIASGDQDGAIRLWDVRSYDIPMPLQSDHKTNVRAIAFSPDASRMVTAADDSTVMLWDLTSGRSRSLTKTDSVQRFAFSPDGKRLVTGGSKGKIRLWDITREQDSEILVFDDLGSEISTVVFSVDGSMLTVTSIQGEIRVWLASRG